MQFTEIYLKTGKRCQVKNPAQKSNKQDILLLIILFIMLVGINYYSNIYMDALEKGAEEYPVSSMSLLDCRNLEDGIGQGGPLISVNRTTYIHPVSREGNFMLETSKQGAGYLVAEIYLDKNQQRVYQSQQMEHGTNLYQIILDSPVSVGIHPATLYVKEYQEGVQTDESSVGITLVVR